MFEAPQTARIADRFAHLVIGRWKWVIAFWILAAVVGRSTSPDWNTLADDGDFEFLPKTMNSIGAESLLDAAFPQERARSQIVLVIGRGTIAMDRVDEIVALDLLRILCHRLAEVAWAKAEAEGWTAGTPVPESRSARWVLRASEALDESIRLDQQYFDTLSELKLVTSIPERSLRLSVAYWDRAELLTRRGESQLAQTDRQAAILLDPSLASGIGTPSERDLVAWSSMVELISWKDTLLGSRLANPAARLAVLQSDAELAATHNILWLEAVNQLILDVERRHAAIVRPGLEILPTGSAAIGGETLTAARDAIRYTEWLTVVMILAILGFVYRAPLLVAIPLVSIGVAVIVSSALVAWLTHLSRDQSLPWLDLRIFTTSRIFVVVILFGAGTDYCLFLISRLREEAALGNWHDACRRTLSGVSGALIGSAMTTIVGLGMLRIAEFGKFRHTGPIVAICLGVGMLVCLTFTPALLRFFGPRVFWPSSTQLHRDPSFLIGQREGTEPTGLWGLIALWLTRYPALALTLGVGLLLIPMAYGVANEGRVTYDLSSQLDPSAKSRRGLALLERHFDIGEINPTTLLLLRPKPDARETLRQDARTLSDSLYSLDGVAAVRSAEDPLGDFPPSRNMGLLSKDAWKRRALKTHRMTRDYFFSEIPQYADRLVRLDVVMSGDPFDIRTAQKVEALGSWVRQLTREADSPWYQAQVLLAGTTPSIIDLRAVTLSDNRRIKVAVVLAVLAILILVLRRVWLCIYLIATVLLSYYATLGLTACFFKLAYGADYVGLDWKLPLFLFVILVAVGQDYNVYLVTRIIEEQREHGGWLSALRRAVARTGGIITACGLVMAATFFSMTASAWLPGVLEAIGVGGASQTAALRGIVELGFALGLGVLIDTFYVRTILVPSFVALVDRHTSRRRSPADSRAPRERR